eukprot:TRINITY_DN18316_c0_g1_i1.p1 TRINITY_DN18316_c0_g1~~TRINITY_DN18316_c0_g1_i1.p1  ORF type:complete len:518 (+),score=184.06 TRINITY_DN18316_c0_g1_i1:121-1674(+)
MATLKRNLAFDKIIHWDRSREDTTARLTKIVCTLGPPHIPGSTGTVDGILRLLDAGMNVCRLNFSHGSHESHAMAIDNLRKALTQREDKVCCLMLDTKGPEIRTGKLEENPEMDRQRRWKLTAGDQVIVDSDVSRPGNSRRIALDYQELCTSTKAGNEILIADGTIALTIKSIDAAQGQCLCIVNNTAVIGENKNVHLPGGTVNLPAIQQKDIEDLQFGLDKGIDAVAASFVKHAHDVKQIRDILGERGKHIKIISKIESTEGLQNIDEIIAASDGIMVARGDLGVEVPLEEIFLCQKMIVSKCNAACKPVITATQMLESMIENPRPTRAEATDVANAVLDGTDCVMLSGETAQGKFPLEAVTYMNKICMKAESAERVTPFPPLFDSLRETTINPDTPEIISAYAVRVANELGASLIITITETGHTSRLVCKYRPSMPVLCVVNSYKVGRSLLLNRAAVPFVVNASSLKGTDQWTLQAMGKAVEMGLGHPGDTVVVISGVVEGVPGRINRLTVKTIP